MADDDIESVGTILRHRGRSDLAGLLRYSTSSISFSSTYGSCAISMLSTFVINSPIKEHEQLLSLNSDDRKVILNAVTQVYPPRDDSPEIYDIEFYPDM